MQKGDWKRKKKKEKHRQRKRAKREETELYRLPEKNDRCANFRLSIYVRVNLFIIQKLTQFFTPTLYKLYCLGLFTCEPNTVTVRYKSRPYIKSLQKYCRQICGYNITFKRINDIIKGAKCNFIEQNC